MSIKNMHYDFQQKLNKIDSKLYKGLKIPEIDWKLNEAYRLYVLLVAEPRLRNQFGFETSLRTTEDMKKLVTSGKELTMVSIPQGYTVGRYEDDHLYYLSTDQMLATKDSCENVKMDVNVIKQNDKNQHEGSVFYKSNFKWRICNISFIAEGIRIFNEDFQVTKFAINYLKMPAYIHNAEDFLTGTYTLPNGVSLTGYQNCELPDITHNEIVDLAVLITTGDLVLPQSYQLKQNKLTIQQLN